MLENPKPSSDSFAFLPESILVKKDLKKFEVDASAGGEYFSGTLGRQDERAAGSVCL